MRAMRWLMSIWPLFLATQVEAYDINGTITDSGGNLIDGIKVDVYDEDIGLDDYLGTIYTNATGQYTLANVSGYGVEDPDITVEWRWPLTGFGSSHVSLLKKLQGAVANDGICI